MVDYAKIQETVESKLASYGHSMTVRLTTRGAYNGTLDTYSESYTDYAVNGLTRQYKNSELGIRQGSGDLIRVGDVEFMISDSDLPALTEENNVTIIDGDSTWYPIRIQPLCPGGTVIFYKIQAARERR